MAQLECRNLSLGYESHVVLEGLNFSINKGDYLCILGENGSGKSTLMRTLLGLQPKLGGEIIMGDGLSQSEIGYLPQQTVVQKDFPASVEEIVISGAVSKSGFFPFYRRADRERSESAMKMMKITDLRRRCYRELSGGQQQRVLLARALVATGKLLLLDEPTAGLDPVVTAEMYELIAELNSYGTTVVMISHDIPSAMKYASHILYIGKDPYFGTRDEFFKSSAASRLGIVKED